MIRVPGKLIYLATQRTASRSVCSMLINQCGGEKLTDSHHAHMFDMPLLKKYSEPVYTFIRNPYEYIAARYCYKKRSLAQRKDCTLEEFVPKYSVISRKHENGSTMCMYRGYVDRYFLFEKGVKAFFSEVGFPNVEVMTLGMGESKRLLDKPPMSNKYKRLVDEYFPEEVEIYAGVRNAL